MNRLHSAAHTLRNAPTIRNDLLYDLSRVRGEHGDAASSCRQMLQKRERFSCA
jgi:hypothetical protein